MARQIATSTKVSQSDLIEFVRPRHRMIVITQRADGSPQASPVTGGVDDSGRIVISTYPERAKAKNARKRADVSVVVLSDDFNDPWVQVDGTCEVLDVPEALDAFVEYFRNISGEHPDWAEYRQAMLDQGKCLMRITPTRWGPVATGGFPARLAKPTDPSPQGRTQGALRGECGMRLAASLMCRGARRIDSGPHDHSRFPHQDVRRLHGGR